MGKYSKGSPGWWGLDCFIEEKPRGRLGGHLSLFFFSSLVHLIPPPDAPVKRSTGDCWL